MVSHMPIRDWCRHFVARRGPEHRHQKHPGHDDQYPLVCIDKAHLSGDATPMLVAKDRRTGMVFALAVERKGAADLRTVEKLAEWVDVLGSTQVTIRSDGEPAIIQVAAAVSDVRNAGSVFTLETSAPGDHCWKWIGRESQWDWWEAWSGHSRMNLGSTARCRYHRNQRPSAWIIGHAATLLNLDTVGSDGKVPFELWRGRGHHMGRCVFGELGVVSSGSVDMIERKSEDRMEPGVRRRFPDEVQRVHFDTERKIRRKPVSDSSDNPEETISVQKGWA